MKVLITLFVILTGTYFCANAQKVDVTGFEGLAAQIDRRDDTLLIINFWATWCAPCVKELPCFEQAHIEYQHQKVKVLLVSLDFEKDINTRLKPFIQKNNITSQVLLLNDPDANTWINQISPEWSGALPATLFVRGNRHMFYEQSFTCEQLNELINLNLN